MGVSMSRKRMGITSLRRFRIVSDPQISPEGRRIAFIHTTIDHKVNDYVSNLWLADSKSGELVQFTSGRGKDRYPRWSPDGSRLLFTSTPPNKVADDEKKAQLFVIRLAGGDGGWHSKSPVVPQRSSHPLHIPRPRGKKAEDRC
jgi:Tol biopolymer transport system component